MKLPDHEVIGDMDLCLLCSEPSRGVGQDLVMSGRIDNLASVWAQFEVGHDGSGKTEPSF